MLLCVCGWACTHGCICSHTFKIGHSLHTELFIFDQKIGPFQMLPLQVRVNLGGMALEGYFTFPKSLALRVLGHQFNGKLVEAGFFFTPMQICSRCILQT